MYVRRAALTILWAVGTAVVWADEPFVLSKKPAEAGAVADQGRLAGKTPFSPAQLTLTFDEYYAQATERSIQDAISIDLIDLNELREAIESQVRWQTLRLSLKECIQIALNQNPDILVTQLAPEKADGDVMSAKGEFDPIAQMRLNYLEASQSSSQQVRAYAGIDAIELWQTTINASLGGKLHFGTQYALTFDLSKEESTYSGFVEEFGGTLTLTLTQPLLRGLSRKANIARITAAQNARLISNEQLKLTVMTTLADVIKAYWDLVGAIENLKVRQESLANAERLLRINETRREIGTAADIEVLQSKAGVAMRQSELISASTAVGNASDALKLLLDLREGDLFSKAEIVPTDRPNPEDISLFDVENYETSLDASIARALKNRPELTMANLEIKSAEVEETRAKKDMMPELDLTGSYMQGGRDHYLRNTFEGIRDQQDTAYSCGVIAAVPIGNRVARGQHLRAKLARREAEERRKKTRQSVLMNVHIAARNVMTNRILVESNLQARRLQEANVVAEEKRMRLGVTTSWQVLQVQEDLTAAQTFEVQAKTAYEKALIDLQLAEGALLENLGIEFEPPDRAKAVNYFLSVLPQKPW